jgi:hypothetical protein
MLKYSLHAPEASTGKNRCLLSLRRGEWLVHNSRRQQSRAIGICRRCAVAEYEDNACDQKKSEKRAGDTSLHEYLGQWCIN